MPNNLNSTGLSVGSLGGVIKEVVDPTGRGFLTLQSDTISKTINDWTTGPNTGNITLPSLSIGSSSIVGYFYGTGFVSETVRIKITLPSSGNYAYTTFESYSQVTLPKTLSMNITTATKSSGGTQIIDMSATGTFKDLVAIVLYYRYS